MDMRELSTCDFCDGEAAGVYEVVPGDIPGVSSRRMVLCADCRDTLSEIVDPLLNAGRRGDQEKSMPAATRTEETAGGGTADTTSKPSPQTETGREPADTRESGSASETEPESERSPEPESERSPEPESEPEPESHSTPERIERPEGYGKVVRLVENRDGGILRRDLEELVSGAYGLSAAEVDDAIEFAIDQGTFEETDSGLKTT